MAPFLRVPEVNAFDCAHVVVVNDSAMRGRIPEWSYAKLELALAVSAHAACGAHFHIMTPRAASNVLLFRVDNLRHQLEHELNSTFKKQAEEVSVPVTSVFLSFPHGSNGLPRNQQVPLRRSTIPGMQAATQKITTLEQSFSGQGDINANSASPDSKRFAYINYAPAEGTAQ